MQRSSGPQAQSQHNPHNMETMPNAGDILFSSTGTQPNEKSLLSSHLNPILSRQLQSNTAFSLVDPNIELPTITANEVDQVLNQIQSSSSCQSSGFPGSLKTAGCWLSKDDSFTPPPIKRSFGGCVTPLMAFTNFEPKPCQFKSSPLIASLQLPLLKTGQVNVSSSTSTPVHAALRRRLLGQQTTLVNTNKQRQDNLTLRLANRAKLTETGGLPVLGKLSAADVDCTAQACSAVSQPSPSSDRHFPQDPDERFRFVCPHPRCGRRYQAPIGLTRHLVKYHEDEVPLASNPLGTTDSVSNVHQEAPTMAVNAEDPSRFAISSLSAPPTSRQMSLRLCFPVRSIRTDQRSCRSLDRSKKQRRCPSPLLCPSTTTLIGSRSCTTSVPLTTNSGSALRSDTSPSLLSEKSVTNVNGSGKVAIVSIQHSPPSSTIDFDHQLHSASLIGMYSNEFSDLFCPSTEVLTEPWSCYNNVKNPPAISTPPYSSSCVWPNDANDFENEEESVLETECSSDIDFNGSHYYNTSRPTDSLPCLLHPAYPPFSPPFFPLIPRSSAIDLSTSGLKEECSSCCWMANSGFSNSICNSRDDRHSSEDGRGLGIEDSWTPSYLKVNPSRQRKQRLSSTSSVMTFFRRKFSITGEKKTRWRYGDRQGRRRTMSSSGGSTGGLLPANTTNTTTDSIDTTRSASVICGLSGDNPSSAGKHSEELVACPVHDCGLVCSGCENLCEHLKECHLPDSRNTPVRLVFACPVKECRAFCANEAAFEAHFDAHLESQTSGKIGDYFRHNATSTFKETDRPKFRNWSRRRHIKSTSSLVDLNMDVFNRLPSVSPDLQAFTSHAADDNSEYLTRVLPNTPSSPSAPTALSEVEGYGLLQALDLLPDDVLHERLQEKMGDSAVIGGVNSHTFPGIISERCCLSPNKQISSALSCSSLSGNGIASIYSDDCQSAGVLVKRQRNSVVHLISPKSEKTTIPRAQSTQLWLKKETPPAQTQPSASRILFSKNSLNSYAVSTEDLCHLADSRQHLCKQSDLTPPIRGNIFPPGSVATLPTNRGVHGCHLSDTDMPPLSSCLLPSLNSSSAYPPPIRLMNRLKRRRRTFANRFLTIEPRFCHQQP